MKTLKYVIPTEYVHKKIKIIAECSRSCGKKSKPIEKTLLVNCKCNDVLIPRDENGNIKLVNQKLILNTKLEKCQSLKYSVNYGQYWQDIKDNILDLKGYSGVIPITIGIYCDVLETIREVAKFNLNVESFTVQIPLINGNTVGDELVPSTNPLIITVDIGGSFVADELYYSIDGSDYEKADSLHFETFLSVGNHNVKAYSLYNGMRSDVAERNIIVKEINILGSSNNDVLRVKSDSNNVLMINN
jgi:hypothetical protein